MKITIVLSTGFLLLGMVSAANASLISRLDGQVVYDTDLDITWLAVAGAIGGQRSWNDAKSWAANLTVGGFTDWRLPTTTWPDPSCSGTDSGTGCIGSEFGHLFNVEGVTADTQGLFSNIIGVSGYWSATEFNSTNAFSFEFHNGRQGVTFKNGHTGLSVWAVRSGDVRVVPTPSTLWLFGAGLGLIGLLRFRALR